MLIRLRLKKIRKVVRTEGEEWGEQKGISQDTPTYFTGAHIPSPVISAHSLYSLGPPLFSMGIVFLLHSALPVSLGPHHYDNISQFASVLTPQTRVVILLLGVWAFSWHAYLCTMCIYCPWRQEGSIRCPRAGVKCGYETLCVCLVSKRGSSGRVVRTFNHRDFSSAPGVSL